MTDIARTWTLLTCPHCGDLWEGLPDDTTVYECAYCGKQGVGVPIRYVPAEQLQVAVEALRELVEASELFFAPKSLGAPLWPRTRKGRELLDSLGSRS